MTEIIKFRLHIPDLARRALFLFVLKITLLKMALPVMADQNDGSDVACVTPPEITVRLIPGDPDGPYPARVRPPTTAEMTELVDLAAAYGEAFNCSRFDEAREHLTRIRAIELQTFGSGHWELAGTNVAFAWLNRQTGAHCVALQHYQTALTIFRGHLGSSEVVAHHEARVRDRFGPSADCHMLMSGVHALPLSHA